MSRLPSENENEYDVDELVEHKREDGEDWYLVKWRGYSDTQSSWEPSTNVTRDLILEFNSRQTHPEVKTSSSTGQRRRAAKQAVGSSSPKPSRRITRSISKASSHSAVKKSSSSSLKSRVVPHVGDAPTIEVIARTSNSSPASRKPARKSLHVYGSSTPVTPTTPISDATATSEDAEESLKSSRKRRRLHKPAVVADDDDSAECDEDTHTQNIDTSVSERKSVTAPVIQAAAPSVSFRSSTSTSVPTAPNVQHSKTITKIPKRPPAPAPTSIASELDDINLSAATDGFHAFLLRCELAEDRTAALTKLLSHKDRGIYERLIDLKGLRIFKNWMYRATDQSEWTVMKPLIEVLLQMFPSHAPTQLKDDVAPMRELVKTVAQTCSDAETKNAAKMLAEHWSTSGRRETMLIRPPSFPVHRRSANNNSSAKSAHAVPVGPSKFAPSAPPAPLRTSAGNVLPASSSTASSSPSGAARAFGSVSSNSRDFDRETIASGEPAAIEYPDYEATCTTCGGFHASESCPQPVASPNPASPNKAWIRQQPWPVPYSPSPSLISTDTVGANASTSTESVSAPSHPLNASITITIPHGDAEVTLKLPKFALSNPNIFQLAEMASNLISRPPSTFPAAQLQYVPPPHTTSSVFSSSVSSSVSTSSPPLSASSKAQKFLQSISQMRNSAYSSTSSSTISSSSCQQATSSSVHSHSGSRSRLPSGSSRSSSRGRSRERRTHRHRRRRSRSRSHSHRRSPSRSRSRSRSSSVSRSSPGAPSRSSPSSHSRSRSRSTSRSHPRHLHSSSRTSRSRHRSRSRSPGSRNPAERSDPVKPSTQSRTFSRPAALPSSSSRNPQVVSRLSSSSSSSPPSSSSSSSSTSSSPALALSLVPSIPSSTPLFPAASSSLSSTLSLPPSTFSLPFERFRSVLITGLPQGTKEDHIISWLRVRILKEQIIKLQFASLPDADTDMCQLELKKMDTVPEVVLLCHLLSYDNDKGCLKCFARKQSAIEFTEQKLKPHLSLSEQKSREQVRSLIIGDLPAIRHPPEQLIPRVPESEEHSTLQFTRRTNPRGYLESKLQRYTAVFLPATWTTFASGPGMFRLWHANCTVAYRDDSDGAPLQGNDRHSKEASAMGLAAEDLIAHHDLDALALRSVMRKRGSLVPSHSSEAQQNCVASEPSGRSYSSIDRPFAPARIDRRLLADDPR